MDILALLLSLVAIVMAYTALQRSGGLKDLRVQMDHLTAKTEDATKGAREATADALRRLENMVRGSGAEPQEKSNNPSKPPEAGSSS
jgi:membrane carboxypeptidase/penicillin-binding protein PbpC